MGAYLREPQANCKIRSISRTATEGEGEMSARVHCGECGAPLINSGGGSISCTVRNISDTGAAIEVESPLYIPDRFKLIVQTDNLNRSCHVVWRKERRIGVAFD